MVAQALPLVLELSRVERKPDPKFVLLHVSGVEDGQLLDVVLVGTDSNEVFAHTLKHSKTSKLKAKNSNITQEEWEAILAAKLLLVAPEDDGLLEGVEAVTEVEGEKSMTIIIQKRIQGITQRLGQIALTYTEEEDINLFEWTGLAIKSNVALKDEIKSFTISLKDKDEQIRRLEETLSELSELKNKNENNLLQKFSQLLNEKKMKIREQQTLLASAHIESIKPEAEDMEVDEPVAAGPSRPRKRKAGAVVEEDSEEDIAPMKMEVDEPGKDVETESDEANQNTASETESDSDTMPSSSVPKPLPGKGKGASSPTIKPVSPPRRKTRGGSAQPGKKQASDEELPPPRALPFQSKATAKKAAPPPPAAVPEGSETESEGDDEL